jgi:hypothetical protein
MSALAASETLTGIAQIAAAFAGFAALVSVLRERGPRVEALHGILRLRIVISTSVVVIAACLVPIGLAHFELSDRAVFGTSAALLLLLNYGVIVSFVRSYEPVRGRFPPDRLAVGLVGTLEVLDQAALVLILLNIWPEHAFSLYLAALILNICEAAFIFLRFVEAEFVAET